MQTPNITPAQTGALTAALAAVIAVIAQAPERLQVPLVAAIALLATAWILGDAVVRHGRSRIEAARVASVTQLPPDALDDAVHVAIKPGMQSALAAVDGDDQAAHAPSEA